MVSLLYSQWYAYRIEFLHVFVYLTYGPYTVYNHMDIVVTRLVTRVVIYLYLRLIRCPDTFSPGDVQAECQNVQIILSCHLVPRITRPRASHEGSSGGLSTAHLGLPQCLSASYILI